MYSDYLNKVAMKKQNAMNCFNDQSSMEVDNQTDEQRQQMLKEYEMEETKEEKAKSMKTGEKYIIRKLISFKINIPKIDDYIQKLSSLEIKHDSSKVGGFGVNTTTASSVENIFSNYGQPMSANNLQNTNNGQYFNQMHGQSMQPNPFKTFQGYNDDSQIAYQSQNFLFHPQMSHPNPYMALNNQIINGLQNLNLNNPGFYWDGTSYQQTNNSTQQMSVSGTSQQYPMGQCHQLNQNSQGFTPYNGNMNSQGAFNSNMMQYNFPYASQGVYNQQTNMEPQYQSRFAQSDEEEAKGLTAEMRLPSHVKKTHFRSNSVTPVDTQANKYMKNSFLFDQLNPINTNVGLKITKAPSENMSTPQLRSTGLDSSNSLPAIRNLSDFYESAVSESSIFDGNDSELASSINIDLDANGQPYFDNMSANGDSANYKMEGEEGSEEVPIKSRKARAGVKKKSAFCGQERKNSVSSDGSLEGGP